MAGFHQVDPCQLIEHDLKPDPPTLSLPPELIDQIIDNVDQPKDLLSLACSCKSFHPRIVPFPLQWRVLHIPLDTIFLPGWEYLASQSIAFLSRSIRVLKFIPSCSSDTRVYHLPDGVWDAILNKQTSNLTVSRGDIIRIPGREERLMKQLVVDFIGRCERLEKLIWTAVGDRDVWLDDRIWRALSRCPRLRTVDIDVRCGRHERIEWDSAIFELSDLYEFTYRSLLVTGDTDRTFESISSMLFKCPNLVSLSLEFRSRRWMREWFVTDILFTGRWPNLKYLSLDDPRGDPKIAGAFFRAHPTIEELSLGQGTLSINDNPACPLPNLRCFRGTPKQLLQLLGPHKSTTIHPLEDITLTGFDNWFHYTSIGENGDMLASPLLKLIGRLPGIVSFTDEISMSHKSPLFPREQQLSLLTRALSNVRTFSLPGIDLTDQNQADWAEAFAHLRHVQTLTVAIQSLFPRSEWIKDFVLRVALACPCLLRIGSRTWSDGDWTVDRESGNVSVQYCVHD